MIFADYQELGGCGYCTGLVSAEVGLTGAPAENTYVGLRIGKSFGAGKVFNNNKAWWSYFPAF